MSADDELERPVSELQFGLRSFLVSVIVFGACTMLIKLNVTLLQEKRNLGLLELLVMIWAWVLIASIHTAFTTRHRILKIAAIVMALIAAIAFVFDAYYWIVISASV